MLIINNKRFQIIITKNILLNNITINILDDDKFSSVLTFFKCLHSHKSKHISKDKNDNEFLNFAIFTKYLCTHASKCISKNNKDND